MIPKEKLVLIIMDGWGLGPMNAANAILAANTPFYDELIRNYPNGKLHTSGEAVGLPQGQMGNSEVGHLNIGAGRVVYQDLVKINKSIAEDKLRSNETLIETFEYCRINNKPLHLMGLISDGGVHSHIDHLIALSDLAEEAGLNEIYIHGFTDGRDTDPKSGIHFISELLSFIQNKKAKLVSIIGRYYAMDRDKRWTRIKNAYDLLVHRKGEESLDLINSIESKYADGITDEFMDPLVLAASGMNNKHAIKSGDAVICFNFRTDRCREITEVLTQSDMSDLEMKKLDLHYSTMTPYDENFKNIHILFPKNNLENTLGEVISKNDLSQIRISETEKYPHVTFFFSGGREAIFNGEKRIMIPSPKVPTYDLKPSMSAFEVKDAIVSELEKGEVDFVCLNFANTDMVGHTGVYSAEIEAVETTDKCVKEVVQAGLKNKYAFLITADHGNGDYMINDDGTPNTAHTTNPVPWILISSNHTESVMDGKLADIAPTILKIMGIDKPIEMSGKELI